MGKSSEDGAIVIASVLKQGTSWESLFTSAAFFYCFNNNAAAKKEIGAKKRQLSALLSANYRLHHDQLFFAKDSQRKLPSKTGGGGDTT